MLPEGFALFYTTLDFHGRLDDAIGRQIAGVIRDHFAIEATLATCTQVHGVAVRKVPRNAMWRECDTCDALWTDERGVALGIKVADCLPVSIIEPGRGVIANIHSGWRGAVKGVMSMALDAISSPGETPGDCGRDARSPGYAYLGPSIRVCCFEVGEEVAAQFDGRYVDRSHSKPHVDVVTMTMDILRNKGFAPARVFDSGLCTRCDGSIFHSFRRDGTRGGRNLAIVAQ